MSGDQDPSIRIGELTSVDGLLVAVLGEPLTCTACGYTCKQWIVPLGDPDQQDEPGEQAAPPPRHDPGEP